MEHLEHFGLSRDPFSNDPQLSVYFASVEHASAERRLRRAVTQQKSLCLLTGPAGAGKSMVVRHLLESLEEEVYEACLLVPVPGVADVDWVLARFAKHLGVAEPAPERAALLGQIYEHMAVVREDGRHTVLILDEVDVLAERGALGDLRALLNLEYEERRLLTLVLVAPAEAEEIFARQRGLAERVDVHVRLRALDADAATQYMTHRIRRVGGSPAILDGGALAALIARAGGIPRRMNAIADNALFEAFLSGRVSATRGDVERAADELALRGDVPVAPAPSAATAAHGAPLPAAAAPGPHDAAPRGAPRRPPAPPPEAVESLFDAPPPPAPRRAGAPRGAEVTTLLSAESEIDEVYAAPTPPPHARSARPATRAPRLEGRGAPDQTMMLPKGATFELEPDEPGGYEARTVAMPVNRPAKDDEEIEDLFADLVEEG